MPNRQPKAPEDLLPLKQSTYRVLLAMPDGESLHGYAIMQAVSEMTHGRETILPGTLYAALARMVEEGLVEAHAAPDGDASGGPARRYYQRTAYGRAVARAESERLRALLDIAVAQKIVPGHRK
jgi:DNA-binding PadR family transcriptional regulator